MISLSGGPSKKNPGKRGRFRSLFRAFPFASLAFSLAVLYAFAQASDSFIPRSKPPDAPSQWKEFIGEYGLGTDATRYFVFERDGQLLLAHASGGEARLKQVSANDFTDSAVLLPRTSNPPLHKDSNGAIGLQVGGMAFLKNLYPSQGGPLHKLPAAHSIEALREAAIHSEPPSENRDFRKPDLVELTSLDPTVHLDIRYASSNDFLGVPVYTQGRAFLQRPAAEALVRVLHKLQPLGYGLLIHDGYRPWYVTKIFWDATPPEGKIFVADPAKGSRHNRGCAVDLTLYDLKSGAPIEMTGYYDEMSARSFPDYPGGTSLERWHRDLLRRAMESEGFIVYESEWWHFDYKDWPEYGILNIPFEKLNVKPN
ncbi:MAG TPA: M15 family metallopeptidase [Candidatus Eremiobacteraceae bacterium]|nr:M15 family metallopeptidase [Candidatus Eremiobacteraceae bacterium]